MTDAAFLVLLLIGLASYVAAVLLVSFVAVAKERNPFAWFVLSLLCTPLLALVALAALPTSRRRASQRA